MRKLGQDGEAFGSRGCGEVLVEGDEGEGRRIVMARDESGRELKRVQGAQAMTHHDSSRVIDDFR